MDELLAVILSTESPRLPEPAVTRAYLALGWGLVLAAALAVWLRARRLWERGWRWLPALVLLWCALPVVATPVYLLGLALQAPSLTLTLWCAAVLWGAYRSDHWPVAITKGLRQAAPVFVVVGLLLLLDAGAWLPGVQLYALGFAPAALPVVMVLAALPWLLGRGVALTGVLWVGAALFLALRLPSGNAWDFVLDPLLVLVLVLTFLKRRD